MERRLRSSSAAHAEELAQVQRQLMSAADDARAAAERTISAYKMGAEERAAELAKEAAAAATAMVRTERDTLAKRVQELEVGTAGAAAAARHPPERAVGRGG